MLITLQLMPIFHDNNRIFVLFPGYSCSGEPCNRCREIINTECKEEVSQYGEMTLHLLLVQVCVLLHFPSSVHTSNYGIDLLR